MVATTGFAAGLEANNTTLSYGIEAVWGTKPATTFQAIRYTSETLKLSRTRQRPLEINTAHEAPAAVTTQQTASGAINYAFSYGTHDDLFAVALANEWSAPLTIVGVAGDIVLTHLTATTATLSTATSNKFATMTLGTWVRLGGFTNAVNNGFWYISAKASNTSLTLTSVRNSITETPTGANAFVRGSTINNGTEFRSLYLQQLFSSTVGLVYPGSFVSGFSLSGRLGQFFNGSFNLLSQNETNVAADQSTGGILAAPGGRVINPVSGFMAVYLDFAAISAAVDQVDINYVNTGAAGEFGLGSASAFGMLAGYAEVSGSFRAYFPDFSIYTQFLAEADHNLSFHFQDNNTDGYVISLYNAAFSDAQISAGGIGQPVYATYQFQANPRPGSSGTIQIDKLSHT